MPFCRECGVELEPGTERCPLCRSGLLDERPSLDARRAYARTLEDLSPGQEQLRRRRGLILAVATLLLAVPGLICLAVDQLYQGGGWSAYVLLSLGLCWALLFIALYSMRHGIVGAMSMLAVAAFYLLGLDGLGGRPDWGLRLAVPILGWTALSVLAGWLCVFFGRRRPTWAAAGVLAAAAVLCLGIDAAADWYLHGAVRLDWSLVAAAALLPVAALVAALGVAHRRSPRLRRFLHW